MKHMWTKSSHSGNHNCVEVVRYENGHVAVRDSKTPYGSAMDAHLGFTSTQFERFLAFIRNA